MTKYYSYTSNKTTELNDNDFDGDSVCYDNDEKSVMSENELYNHRNFDDYHHPPQSKPDSKKLL